MSGHAATAGVHSLSSTRERVAAVAREDEKAALSIAIVESEIGGACTLGPYAYFRPDPLPK